MSYNKTHPGRIPRQSTISRCCQCLQLLSTRSMTATELSLESGISIAAIRRYITDISLYFPLIEAETKTDSGNIAISYKIDSLIDKTQLKKDLIRELTYIIQTNL